MKFKVVGEPRFDLTIIVGIETGHSIADVQIGRSAEKTRLMLTDTTLPD